MYLFIKGPISLETHFSLLLSVHCSPSLAELFSSAANQREARY